MDVNDEFGGSMNLQGLESFVRVRVETSTSPARYKTPASCVVNTKSGANQLRGSLYDPQTTGHQKRESEARCLPSEIPSPPTGCLHNEGVHGRSRRTSRLPAPLPIPGAATHRRYDDGTVDGLERNSTGAVPTNRRPTPVRSLEERRCASRSRPNTRLHHLQLHPEGASMLT